MLGGFIGLGALFLAALPDMLPAAVAEDQPMRTVLRSASQLLPSPVDPSSLVNWDFQVEPGVSVEPVSETSIKKIGYGHTSYVDVMETESGVYSTDGLNSPNIQYPGITKEPKVAAAPILWLWSDGRWSSVAAFGAGSSVIVTPFKGGRLVTTDSGQCAVFHNAVYC
jgi:hypothetical protein